MTKRPTKDPHFGFVHNANTFEQAYKAILQNPHKTYATKAGTPFTAEAKTTISGPHKGEKVIVFKQGGKEMARSYKCCWGAQTNCNRTYIDSYTPAI